MIKCLSVYGLRGFGKQQDIEFSIPNGSEGSGITFLVGSNNSGKTTILEALRSFNCYSHEPPSYSEKKRNKKCENGKVHISLTTDNDTLFSIDTADRGGSPTVLKVNGVLVDGTWDPPMIFVLQSRRFVDYEFHRNEMSKFDYVHNLQSNYHNRSAALSEYSSRLFSMYHHKDDFDPMLKSILGYDLEWTIEQNENGTYYLKLILGGCEHSSEGMGDGIWSIFTICDALYDSKPGDTIAIDEPELSLHPAYQKKVLLLLKEYSKDRQIIISTHSPYFIDLPSLINGAYLYRTLKDEQGDIDVYALSQESKDNLGAFINDINQPHTFGTEAKELFFLEDKIILVEGQEDVIMYQLAAHSVGINLSGSFFGWGAGGAPKIPFVLQLLKDLGYKKVAVVFDGDKLTDKGTMEVLYPDYQFFAISTADIRDKKEIKNKPGKCGMMTIGGKLKDEFVEEMTKLLTNINECLS